MAIPEGAEAGLAAKFTVMRELLDERQWRVYLGTEAQALGHGGIAAVARASGASQTTVAAGAAEAGNRDALAGLARGRARRPGAGRPKAEDAQPGLGQALGSLVEEATRGDPMSEITWCSRSLRDLERQMAARGFRCGKDAIARMLRGQGYSLQAMAKVLEGRQHPGRDGQFRHINAMIAAFRAAGYPVISVDTKKKEQLGPFHRDGRAWRPQGDPVRVRDHDFPDPKLGKITPYGVYDIAADTGFVSIGTSHDTAAFAVSALRLWWQHEGSLRYRGATRLLVTCDAGGSNGYRCRGWKDQLAELARESGLKISVVHFPPGTSKQNRIEHRLFCHITRTWRTRPLMTADDAVAGIAATITSAGLKCTAVRDDAAYPDGAKISGERMRYLKDRVVIRHGPHPCWNYTILPAPRPAPAPQPAPQPAGRCPQAMLNHPALTGMDPADVTALAAALQIPCGARREQAAYARRGGPRTRALSNGDGSRSDRKLDLTDYVLAVRLRDHLHLTGNLTGTLLGADPTTVSHAISLTRQLLASSGIALPPAAPPPGTPLRTPSDLRDYAAAAGITLTIPQTRPKTPKYTRRKRAEPATRPEQPT
ncbi:MAG TPA: ISAzo13 family transposase [Streptosporangiaceae bacterium]|nr:ISAzo13 family transposase [Streptosporangiaceae bacterium]